MSGLDPAAHTPSPAPQADPAADHVTPSPVGAGAHSSVDPAQASAMFWEDLTTLPNLMCVYRYFGIIAAVVLLHWFNQGLWALALGITAGLTDYLDGWVARRRNQVTELGALLDQASDLVFAFLCISMAVDRGVWPYYLLVLWGLRDLTVLAMRQGAAQLGFSIPSIFLGKVASNVNFYSFVILGLIVWGRDQHADAAWLPGLELFGLSAIHVGIAMQWVTMFVYMRSFVRLYRR